MPKLKQLPKALAKRMGYRRTKLKHKARHELKHFGTYTPLKPILGVSVQPETGKKRTRFT